MRHFEMMAANFLEQICLNERRRSELIPIAQQTAEDKVRQWQWNDHVRISRSAAPLKESGGDKLEGEVFLFFRSTAVEFGKWGVPGPLFPALGGSQDASDSKFGAHEIERKIRSRQEIARQERVERVVKKREADFHFLTGRDVFGPPLPFVEQEGGG